MTAPAAAGWRPVLVAAAAALAVATLGATMTDLGPWYQSLRQPDWKPPDWLFGPGWTLIFALAALAGVKAWRAAPDGASRALVLLLFAFNGLLNVLWSALFFRFRAPGWALFEVVFLWASVATLIIVLWRWSRGASALLVPYLAWVSFAGALNLAVVRLN